MQLTQSRKPAQVTPKQSRASEVKKVMSNKPSAKIDSTLSVVPQSTRAIRGDARSNNGQSTARSLSKPGASSRGEFSG